MKTRFIIILFSVLSYVAYAESVSDAIYYSYVYKDMDRWKAVIDSLQAEKHKGNLNISQQWDLLNYQYGYIAWAISKKKEKKDEAENYLALANENLEDLEELFAKTPILYAYKSAFIAYEIGLSPIKAPFVGLKSIKYGEKAVEQDSLSYISLIQYGNIMNYMPTIFGGSKPKAIKYYKKAKSIMEKDSTLVEKNWLYMNILLTLADIYKNQAQYDSTQVYYQNALKIQPEYPYIEDALMPSLLVKKNLSKTKNEKIKKRNK